MGSVPGVSGMVNAAVGSRSFTLQGLPVGLDLDRVTPQPDGLELHFQGNGVHLAG
jgi:hypothetical protein